MTLQSTIDFASALTTSDYTNSIKHMKIAESFGFLGLISDGDIKASKEFKLFATNVSKHSGVLYTMPLDGDFTITDFVSAMIYINSQARSDKTERWSLDNLPSKQSKALGKALMADFVKSKTSFGWMQ
jgi:hypothetical protein